MLNKLKELLICNCRGYCLTLCTDQPLPCSIIRMSERKKKSRWHYDSSAPRRYILDLHSQHLLALMKNWIYYRSWWICHLYFFFFLLCENSWCAYVLLSLMWFCKRVQWHTYALSLAKRSRTDLRGSLDMHEVQCSLSEGKTFLQQSLSASDSHPFRWIGPQETSWLNDVRIRGQEKDRLRERLSMFSYS